MEYPLNIFLVSVNYHTPIHTKIVGVTEIVTPSLCSCFDMDLLWGYIFWDVIHVVERLAWTAFRIFTEVQESTAPTN